MSIVDTTGAILTKAQLLAKTTTVPQPAIVKFTEDVYETFAYPGSTNSFEDNKSGGKRKLFRNGQVVSQAIIDAMYSASAASFTSITPNSGLAAGGTPVTITGKGFAGNKGVTIGGVAATSVKVVSDIKITCVTGPHAAGAVPLVIQDASGDVTAPAAFTYA